MAANATFLKGNHFFGLMSAVAFAVLSSAAISAEKELPQVPGDEIFGFTSVTDLGQVGDLSFGNENDGRIGKRGGSYGALNTKYELSYVFAPDWWIAGSFFGAHNKSRNVPGMLDVNHGKFDGLSFEHAHKIISRSETNPFAVTLSVEPRWGRVDGASGLNSNSYGVEFKLFTDAVIVPDKLFWAANLQASTQKSQDPLALGVWSPSSQVVLSSALTWQASTQLFLGAEARYFTSFDTGYLAHPVERALYVGPTILWKINEKMALNATFQPQVYGRSKASPGFNLDFDNFERAQFRLKFAMSF